jgi:ParB family chromosome partitioning protein
MAKWRVHPDEEPSRQAQTLADQVERDGGTVLAVYREPVGDHWQIFALLPMDKVEPTPYQRDLSPTHVKRLQEVVKKIDRFVDPVVIMSPRPGVYWTPNGNHRRAVLAKLKVKTIPAILVPEHEVAFQILALNTEKAHNLKEKSLEVIRIYRGLLDEDKSRPEKQFAFYLEEASFVTLGLCYEANPRFSGGAYNSIVRRLSAFSDEPLSRSVKVREKTAEQLMDLDGKVAEVVAKLKAKGFVSPYLKAFVVARINPLRWIQGEPPPLEEVLKTMRERAAKFNVDKIKQEDLASAAGAADEPD